MFQAGNSISEGLPVTTEIMHLKCILYAFITEDTRRTVAYGDFPQID